MCVFEREEEGGGEVKWEGVVGPETHKCFHLALLEVGPGDSSPISGVGWDKQSVLCQP